MNRGRSVASRWHAAYGIQPLLSAGLLIESLIGSSGLLLTALVRARALQETLARRGVLG